MEDAKRIVVAGCRQVLEDGPDVCGSESDAEYSDHGEELEGMYTKGSSLASASLTTAQANALRAQSKGQSVPVPEQRLPTPVPSDGEDLDYEQARALRRFMNKKGRAVGLVTDLGKG
jgi:hypothetical protein